jgi:osmotically-inducible protein OsmY
MTTKIDDTELRRRVLAELDWEPTIDASAIGVAAKDGVVTLTGSVTSYAHKKNAERAAKRVSGVKAVAEDVMIRLPGEAQRGDTDIAQSVLSALRFNVAIPYDKIQVTVESGWVTLDGEVEWQFQRTITENAIKYTLGVKGVTNRITVKPRINAADVKAKIEGAFARHAQLDADKIRIEATESKVVLRGSVRSWREREDAEQAAWSAPGVSRVENDVVVSPW